MLKSINACNIVWMVIEDGVDKNGKPHKLRSYSIASSAH